jgi:hypothetical protein
MKRLGRPGRETLLLIGLGIAVAAELTWVVHHVEAEVIDVPEVTASSNPTHFTENVIQAANPTLPPQSTAVSTSHLQH